MNFFQRLSPTAKRALAASVVALGLHLAGSLLIDGYGSAFTLRVKSGRLIATVVQ